MWGEIFLQVGKSKRYIGDLEKQFVKVVYNNNNNKKQRKFWFFLVRFRKYNFYEVE